MLEVVDQGAQLRADGALGPAGPDLGGLQRHVVEQAPEVLQGFTVAGLGEVKQEGEPEAGVMLS